MEEKTSMIKKIISIFWEPSTTFNALEKQVTAFDIILPLLLVTIVAWISTPFSTPIALNEQKETITQSDHFSQLPEDQQQKMLERMDAGGKVGAYVGSPIFVTLSSLVLAAVLIFAGNFILGGDRKFTELWAVAAYGGLIDIVASAVKVPLMVQKNTMKIYTSLAIFMDESSGFFYQLMTKLDIFTLWKVVVFSIGLSVLYRKKLTKPLTIMIVIWLLYCLGAASLAGLNPYS